MPPGWHKLLNVDSDGGLTDDIRMSLLETAIGVIAPPECLVCGAEGAALCQVCAESYIKPFGERCWRCDKLSPASRTCASCRGAGGPRSAWICTTYSGIAQQLVQQYKFGHLRAAAGPLAGLMAGVQEASGIILKDHLVVPVPTATSRRRQRGFGHSELLARTIGHRLGLSYSDALRRLGQTRQLGARREDRLAQLAGSFAAKTPRRLSGRDILLVDDVITTGGTLIAAERALRAAGVRRVDALLFAKKL